MKIKRVTIEGMHNVDKKVYDFGNLTYLHGPNGAGKSTVLQAVQLALLGYIPGTNKTKDAIFQHSNSILMSVILELDDNGQDVRVERVWHGRSKASISSVVLITPEKYDIASVIGSLELPIFNFSEFLGMTANKLKDWFIEFLPSEDVSVDWEKVLSESVPTTSESELASTICGELVADAMSEIRSMDARGVDQVRKANEYFKSALSFKKKELERAQSTIQSLVFHDDVSADVDEEEVVAKIRRYEQLANAARDVQRDIADNEAHNAFLERAAASGITADSVEADPRYLDLKSQYESVSKQVAAGSTSKSFAADIKDLVDRRNDVLAQVSMKADVIRSKGVCPLTKKLCDPVKDLVGSYQKDVDAARDEVAEIDAKLKQLNASVADADREYHEACRKQSEIQSAMQQLTSQYEHRDHIRSQIKPIDTSVDLSVDYYAELRELRDLQVKIEANKRYNKLIDEFTANKFRIEMEIATYKAWIKLTDVNGLQSSQSSSNPFTVLGSKMDRYLQAVFGDSVSAGFNLESKANSFNFGINRDNHYIPFNLLSSGEKCMYTLALMMGLVESSDSKLKLVMVDDLMDHLDDNNIQNLFDSLAKVSDIQMIFAGVKSVSGSFVVEVA